MKEIGSEFWFDDNFSNASENCSAGDFFMLSGRTAIDFIIKDIKSERSVKKVMMPSYCCDSMIEPFINNEIEVSFYSVGADSVKYDFNNDGEIVFVMDYFGFSMPKMKEIAKREAENGKIIIYDSTHFLKTDEEWKKIAIYIFTSYRKWYFANFASVEKLIGEFTEKAPQKTNEKYIELRNKAAKLKTDFINGKDICKDSFLNLFSLAEENLDEDYKNYFGVPRWQNFDEILKVRKENAEVLIDEIKNIDGISLWKSEIETHDFPMFVPIFLEEKSRNDLRNFLISNGIFCPVHWPLTDFHKIKESDKKIYSSELSLICDQRYTKQDIRRQAGLIKKFFEEV